MHQNTKIKNALTGSMAVVGVWGAFEALESVFSVFSFHPESLVRHGGETVLAYFITKGLRSLRRDAAKKAPVTP